LLRSDDPIQTARHKEIILFIEEMLGGQLEFYAIQAAVERATGKGQAEQIDRVDSMDLDSEGAVSAEEN
jgi:hypothetical protein